MIKFWLATARTSSMNDNEICSLFASVFTSFTGIINEYPDIRSLSAPVRSRSYPFSSRKLVQLLG